MKNISTCLFLLLLLNYVPMDASAQPSARELLRQKTNSQLREIVEQSPAITGLVALDLTSGERFEIHPDVVFPQASAIKIPILMAVYQGAQRGKYKMNDIRPVEAKTVVGGTGILKDMLDPASLTIRNLGVLMIALSDNTATNALIDLVGMPEINATLQSLGLQQTKVQRKMINSAASGRGEPVHARRSHKGAGTAVQR
jgi:beta-lactamase class A